MKPAQKSSTKKVVGNKTTILALSKRRRASSPLPLRQQSPSKVQSKSRKSEGSLQKGTEKRKQTPEGRKTWNSSGSRTELGLNGPELQMLRKSENEIAEKSRKRRPSAEGQDSSDGNESDLFFDVMIPISSGDEGFGSGDEEIESVPTGAMATTTKDSKTHEMGSEMETDEIKESKAGASSSKDDQTMLPASQTSTCAEGSTPPKRSRGRPMKKKSKTEQSPVKSPVEERTLAPSTSNENVWMAPAISRKEKKENETKQEQEKSENVEMETEKPAKKTPRKKTEIADVPMTPSSTQPAPSTTNSASKGSSTQISPSAPSETLEGPAGSTRQRIKSLEKTASTKSTPQKAAPQVTAPKKKTAEKGKEEEKKEKESSQRETRQTVKKEAEIAQKKEENVVKATPPKRKSSKKVEEEKEGVQQSKKEEKNQAATPTKSAKEATTVQAAQPTDSQEPAQAPPTVEGGRRTSQRIREQTEHSKATKVERAVKSVAKPTAVEINTASESSEDEKREQKSDVGEHKMIVDQTQEKTLPVKKRGVRISKSKDSEQPEKMKMEPEIPIEIKPEGQQQTVELVLTTDELTKSERTITPTFESTVDQQAASVLLLLPAGAGDEGSQEFQIEEHGGEKAVTRRHPGSSPGGMKSRQTTKFADYSKPRHDFGQVVVGQHRTTNTVLAAKSQRPQRRVVTTRRRQWEESDTEEVDSEDEDEQRHVFESRAEERKVYETRSKSSGGKKVAATAMGEEQRGVSEEGEGEEDNQKEDLTYDYEAPPLIDVLDDARAMPRRKRARVRSSSQSQYRSGAAAQNRYRNPPLEIGATEIATPTPTPPAAVGLRPAHPPYHKRGTKLGFIPYVVERLDRLQDNHRVIRMLHKMILDTPYNALYAREALFEFSGFTHLPESELAERKEQFATLDMEDLQDMCDLFDVPFFPDDKGCSVDSLFRFLEEPTKPYRPLPPFVRRGSVARALPPPPPPRKIPPSFARGSARGSGGGGGPQHFTRGGRAFYHSAPLAARPNSAPIPIPLPSAPPQRRGVPKGVQIGFGNRRPPGVLIPQQKPAAAARALQIGEKENSNSGDQQPMEDFPDPSQLIPGLVLDNNNGGGAAAELTPHSARSVVAALDLLGTAPILANPDRDRDPVPPEAPTQTQTNFVEATLPTPQLSQSDQATTVPTLQEVGNSTSPMPVGIPVFATPWKIVPPLSPPPFFDPRFLANMFANFTKSSFQIAAVAAAAANLNRAEPLNVISPPPAVPWPSPNPPVVFAPLGLQFPSNQIPQPAQPPSGDLNLTTPGAAAQVSHQTPELTLSIEPQQTPVVDQSDQNISAQSPATISTTPTQEQSSTPL